MSSSSVPAPVEDVQGDARWMSVHQRYLIDAKEREPEVVFIGDSIIERLMHCEVWDNMCVPLHCVNFGIGGDQTQNVLWRVENGELDNMEPKVIVLLVGTNNHEHTAEQVTEGILEIVKTIRSKQEQAQVVVMGIPPRGQNPNRLREKIAEVNTSLAELLQGMENVQFFNVDPAVFVRHDGTISHTDMYDYLHFTKVGYQKLIEPLLDEIQGMIKDFMKTDCSSLGDPEN